VIDGRDSQVPRVSVDPLGVETHYLAALPSWLKLSQDGKNQNFSGTPAFSDVDDFEVQLKCVDNFGEYAIATFKVRVWGTCARCCACHDVVVAAAHARLRMLVFACECVVAWVQASASCRDIHVRSGAARRCCCCY
jgi:hypothetical protein